MRFTFTLITLSIFTISCSTNKMLQKSTTPVIKMKLNLKKPADDLFHVTVKVSNLSENNNIFNFAATVPGTYANLNFGRFVKSFIAYDANGNEIKSKKISTNQYQLSNPSKIRKIIYSIEDSYDSDLEPKGKGIFPMGGTEIDLDHAIINTFGVFGYFKGLQSAPIKLRLSLPSDWSEGTALQKVGDAYVADTYDHLADSPILAGKLTKGKLNAGGINIELYTYSSNGVLKADSLIKISAQVLRDAEKFISYPIVKRYVFLMSFLDQTTIARNNFRGMGALEHSYSSFYVLPEYPQMYRRVSDISAHEFFHVMTPLNIHSEIIEKFNFSKPRASRHLWLYEGITEWASDIMQLRNQSMNLKKYLTKISSKITTDKKYFDKNYSLEKLSTTSYDSIGASQYGNIYERGAYIATLLDLKLLKLSDGKRGLREVIIALAKKFGKSRAFDDARFYETFTKETNYPEIRQFISNYIQGTKDFPIREYFSWIGIDYIEKEEVAKIGVSFSPGTEGRFRISSLNPKQRDMEKLETGDTILEVDGNDITLKNFKPIFEKFKSKKIGDKITFKLKRDDKILTVTTKMVQSFNKNILKLIKKPTAEQLRLQKAWLVNLPIKSN